jgi:hypothetical protein
VIDKFGDGNHTVADIYRWSRGAWRHVARVDFGVASEPPDRGAPPSLAHLTGATDFVVMTAGATTPLLSVVSNVTGKWHLVEFVRSGQPTVTAVTYGVVHGNRIRSAVDDCEPNCAQGKFTYTTWAYTAAGSFQPTGARPGPCVSETVTLGNLQAIGCFTRRGRNTYETSKRFRLWGSIRHLAVQTALSGTATVIAGGPGLTPSRAATVHFAAQGASKRRRDRR